MGSCVGFFIFFFLAYLFIVNCRVHVHGVQRDSRVSIFLPSFSSLFFNYNQYMWYYFGFSFGVESADCLIEIGVPFGQYYFAASLENYMVWFCVSSLCRDENGFLNFFSFFPFHLFHIKACFVLSLSRLQLFLSPSLNFFFSFFYSFY